MKVIVWCVDKFRYYIVFSSILFISGLIFSHMLLGMAVFDILITYLTEAWTDKDLRKAAILVNLQEGSCAVLQIFFGFVADAYSGLFKMVVCSTILCIIGLLLSCFAAWNGEGFLDLRLFYPALVLMTLSRAATDVSLKAFFGDQVLARDRVRLTTEEEEERAHKRSKFWWNTVSIWAAIVAFFISHIVSFRVLLMVSAIAMGAAFLWFLLGTKLYTCAKPTGSPLSNVYCVIHCAIVKRNVQYPETPEQILPDVSWLRWLDRAVVELQEEENLGHDCAVERVKGVKFLLKMLPMWTTFLTFSLVAASGSTFFLEEATSIDKNFPILSFTILQRFTGFMVSEISDSVLEKLGKKKNINIGQRVMLVRIGIGMICCVLCCIVAWTNAVHRLHLVKIYGDPKEYMSAFRLTPQFLLLAVMEGLSEDGLENFFDSQVSKSISRYGPQFGECVMGVGKFLSVLCILILSRWFKDDVNLSRLDKYYAVLAILSCVNIVVYCLFAYWYGDDRFLSEDADDLEMGNSVQQVGSVGPLAPRSLSGKGHYSHRSLSGRIVPITEEGSFGDDLTENTDDSEHESQTPPEETGQETKSSSSRCDDHEAETLLKPDDVIDSTDQVSPLVPLLSQAASFPPPYLRGIRKRFLSMR